MKKLFAIIFTLLVAIPGWAKEPKTLMWEELTPPPDMNIVEKYNKGELDQSQIMSYITKLMNQVQPELNNTYVKMPGYLVPLNLTRNQMATEFLLVPSQGACIHTPPPPPNQTVYLTIKEGMKVTEAASIPYWITGKLTTQKKTSEYTDALYSMQVEEVVKYSR